MNKYIKFYHSVKDFLIKTEIVYPTNIEAASLEEIESFEKEFDFKFPLSIKSFLLLFGKKVKLNINNCREMYYTLESFREGLEMAREREFFKTLPDFTGNIKDYLFFRADDRSEMHIYFCKLGEDNPLLFLQWSTFNHEDYMGNYGLDLRRISKMRNFINTIRTDTFSLISSQMRFLDHPYPGKKVAQIRDIPWAMYYHRLLNKKVDDKDYMNIGSLFELREEFYTVISPIEETEDRILTMDEFEWAFIDYLKEKGYSV